MSCIKASDVTGLVMDAIRNSASAVSARPVETSATPKAP